MTLHFLHVGKTGGTAIKDVIVSQLGVGKTPYGPISHASADTTTLRHVPPEDYFFFCVRDPIARFASAFWSRYNKGKPRYFFQWFPGEAEAFSRFQTPQALASALYSRDTDERNAAQTAMLMIKHVKRMTERLGTRSELEERIDRIVYVGRQETLPADWQHLRSLLDLPADSQLPGDPVRSHRGDPTLDRSFDEAQTAALRRWYAADFEIVEFAEQMRRERGWGEPVPDAVPGQAEPSLPPPLLPAHVEPSHQTLQVLVRDKVPPHVIWTELLRSREAKRVAEIGVFRGKLAQELLNKVPTLDTYFLLGPDQRSDGRQEPETAEADYRIAIERTTWPSFPEVVSGTIDEGLDKIEDGSLDAFLLGYGYDRGLRAITLALHRAWPKVRDGGWIGGYGFAPNVFESARDVEPSMTFPYARHFAEAMGVPVFGLPNQQFLLVKDQASGFGFVDVTATRAPTDLLPQLLRFLGREARVVEARPRPRWWQPGGGRSIVIGRAARLLGMSPGRAHDLEIKLQRASRKLKRARRGRR